MLSLSVDEAAASYQNPYVVIVDDQSVSLSILTEIVKSIRMDISVRSFSQPDKALEQIKQRQPDLIITDYMMPEMNGLEFTRQIRLQPACENIPIIMVTIMNDKAVLHQALEQGVTDFLHKPFDHNECKARCRNLLSLALHQNRLRHRSDYLQSKVEEGLEEILLREKETLNRLTRACTYKDCITGEHLLRLGKLSRMLAIELGMTLESAELIEIASPLHDIGKIAIPDSILMKKEKLTEAEFAIMKTHTTVGYDILKDSPSPYLKAGALIALNHHEKFDGSGYPYGISGNNIPIEARIVTLADVFDSLTNHRPYKKAWPIDETLDYIHTQKGLHFDPDCVDALVNILDNSDAFDKEKCSNSLELQ